MSPERDVNEPSLDQQLSIAMETINGFAGWVVNADTKIATLSTVQVVMALFMAAQPLSRVWPADSLPRQLGLVMEIIFVISLLAAVRHLGAALRPRLSTGPEVNHFVFPSVARIAPGDLGVAPVGDLISQAWAQAHALSVIAVLRYRHFSRALTWAYLNVSALIVWLVVAGQIS